MLVHHADFLSLDLFPSQSALPSCFNPQPSHCRMVRCVLVFVFVFPEVMPSKWRQEPLDHPTRAVSWCEQPCWRSPSTVHCLPPQLTGNCTDTWLTFKKKTHLLWKLHVHTSSNVHCGYKYFFPILATEMWVIFPQALSSIKSEAG